VTAEQIMAGITAEKSGSAAGGARRPRGRQGPPAGDQATAAG